MPSHSTDSSQDTRRAVRYSRTPSWSTPAVSPALSPTSSPVTRLQAAASATAGLSGSAEDSRRTSTTSSGLHSELLQRELVQYWNTQHSLGNLNRSHDSDFDRLTQYRSRATPPHSAPFQVLSPRRKTFSSSPRALSPAWASELRRYSQRSPTLEPFDETSGQTDQHANLSSSRHGQPARAASHPNLQGFVRSPRASYAPWQYAPRSSATQDEPPDEDNQLFRDNVSHRLLKDDLSQSHASSNSQSTAAYLTPEEPSGTSQDLSRSLGAPKPQRALVRLSTDQKDDFSALFHPTSAGGHSPTGLGIGIGSGENETREALNKVSSALQDSVLMEAPEEAGPSRSLATRRGKRVEALQVFKPRRNEVSGASSTEANGTHSSGAQSHHHPSGESSEKTPTSSRTRRHTRSPPLPSPRSSSLQNLRSNTTTHLSPQSEKRVLPLVHRDRVLGRDVKDSSPSMPNTPLKNPETPLEVRHRIADLDRIEVAQRNGPDFLAASAGLGLDMKSALPEQNFSLAHTSPPASMIDRSSASNQARVRSISLHALPPTMMLTSTEPTMHADGSSAKAKGREQPRQASEKGNDRNYGFIRGPLGYESKRASTGDENSSHHGRYNQPTSDTRPSTAQSGDVLSLEGNAASSSEAEAFVYLPSAIPRESHLEPQTRNDDQSHTLRATVEHVAQHILSAREFRSVLAGMQFDAQQGPGMAQTRKEGSGSPPQQCRQTWVRCIIGLTMYLAYLALFFVFDAPYMWYTYTAGSVAVAIYLTVVALVSMFACIFLDPGTIPQQMDGDTLSTNGAAQRNAWIAEISALDEDSPRRKLALANLRRHFQNPTPVRCDASMRTGGTRTNGIIAPPKNLLSNRQGADPKQIASPLEPLAEEEFTVDYRTPLQTRAASPSVHWATMDQVRALPLTDASGRQTWLVYHASPFRSSEGNTQVKKVGETWPSCWKGRNRRPQSTFGQVPTARSSPAISRKWNKEGHRSLSADQNSHAAITRSVPIGSIEVQMRACSTCQTFTPPKSYHCSYCGRCCQDLQYHCAWLANDVGAGTIVPFLVLISSSALLFAYTATFAALHIAKLARIPSNADLPGRLTPGLATHSGSFRLALRGTPTSGIVFVVGTLGFSLGISRLLQLLVCIAQGQTLLQKVSCG